MVEPNTSTANDNWREVKLAQLGRVERGRSRHRPRHAPELYGGPYPFIQTGDIKASGGRITSHTQTYSEAGLAQSRLWPVNTLAITIAANIAETAILTYPACFPDSVVGFVADEAECDVRFVENIFRHLRSQIQHEHVGTGSVQDNINLRTLDELRFLAPPLPEQRAISHVLSTLDDKIELNRRMNRTLEEMSQAIFQDWFVDFGPTRAKMEGRDPYLPTELWDLFPDEMVNSELGGIPRGWNIKKLGEICTLRAGSTFPKAKQGSRLGTYPFAKVSDMNLAGNSLAILKAANWVGDEDLPQLKAKPLPEGTTVFAKIGEALKQNRLRITLQPTLIDNNMMGAIPDTEVIDHIILFRSLSRFDFGELSGGTALPYLTQKDLSALMIPVPPTDGQRIMSRHIQTLHEKAITNEREAISLLDIRDMILPKLISGKLLVRTWAKEC